MPVSYGPVVDLAPTALQNGPANVGLVSTPIPCVPVMSPGLKPKGGGAGEEWTLPHSQTESQKMQRTQRATNPLDIIMPW